ncbi:MAG: two pore domain potassium channel family protein [Rubrobacter sp.]|nr:two pore domain potassium channel family protein [Rubrobacter sp.]
MGHYRVAHVLIVGAASVVLSTVLMVEFERRGDGPIHSFGDALWWAIATVTTVGYGETSSP